MNWDAIWQDLEGAFRLTAIRIKARFPDIGVGIVNDREALAEPLEGFTHYPASAEWEDVLLEMTCGSSATAGFWMADGSPLFPNTPQQDAIRFEISLGGGPTLAHLDPRLLPEGRESNEYADLVRRFVSDSIYLIERSVPLMVDALAKSASPP